MVSFAVYTIVRFTLTIFQGREACSFAAGCSSTCSCSTKELIYQATTYKFVLNGYIRPKDDAPHTPPLGPLVVVFVGLGLGSAGLGQGTGKLSMVVWERFLVHLKPRTTQQERALYFEIASSFADTLDVLGFMDLRQASHSSHSVIQSALSLLQIRSPSLGVSIIHARVLTLVGLIR